MIIKNDNSKTGKWLAWSYSQDAVFVLVETEDHRINEWSISVCSIVPDEQTSEKEESPGTASNIGSLKLPRFNEAMSGIPESFAGSIDSNDYMRGAKHMYEFIERQLKAGA